MLINEEDRKEFLNHSNTVCDLLADGTKNFLDKS
jgi:hypothetical protein